MPVCETITATGVPQRGYHPPRPIWAASRSAARLSFAGYSEGLPAAGSTVCWAGAYARKHAPWVAFSNIPGADNRPMEAFGDFNRLPTVSFVIPNVQNDMHDGTVAQADAWARDRIAPLVSRYERTIRW